MCGELEYKHIRLNDKPEAAKKEAADCKKELVGVGVKF